MKRATVQIPSHKLHFLGQLMCEVLHEKKAVESIGTTTLDLECQIQYLLNILRNKNKNQFNKLLESTQHLEKCGYKNYSWE